MSNYTVELTKELEAQESWTYAQTAEFAANHGLKHRSVIAKVKSLGLAYEPKPARVNKRMEPIVKKAQFVASIQEALGVVVPSMEKMTKADLEALTAAVGAEMPQPE